MILNKILSNGYQVVVKTTGNQTLTQLYNSVGDLIITRAKQISKSAMQTSAPRKRIGFAMQNADTGIQQKIKDIITIKKNTYVHNAKMSNASVLDKVYSDGENLGERLYYTNAIGNPMDAMEAITSRGNSSSVLNKILRVFKDSEVIKENRYEYVNGVRRSKEIVDFDLEKQIAVAKKEIEKIKLPKKDNLDQELFLIKSEIKEVELEANYKRLLLKQTEVLKNLKAKRECIEKQQILQNLLQESTTGNHTPAEYRKALKRIDSCLDDTQRSAVRGLYGETLCLQEDYEKTLVDKLRLHFKYLLDIDFDVQFAKIDDELNRQDEKFALERRKCVNLLIYKEELKEQERVLESRFEQKRAEIENLTSYKKTLERELEAIESKRQIIDFVGAKTRTNIDGVEFTI